MDIKVLTVDELKNLKMHEYVRITPYTWVLRVPGGVLYKTNETYACHVVYVPLFGVVTVDQDPLWIDRAKGGVRG